jgi:UDP-3-O-[3-hydroxymyristoyl] glucosamine N-acyltransferase
VHLAHNVVVGEHSFLVAQVGVSGSTRLGKRVALGGQVGLAGHIELGDGVQVGAQSGVNHSLPPGEIVSGYPARPQQEWLKIMASLPRLPSLNRKMKQMEQKLQELAAKLEKEMES